MSTQLLYQGAEARLYLSTYLTVPAVIKERLSKKYRVPELDVKLNKQRLLQEARCMVKCRRAGVRTPWLVALIDCSTPIVVLRSTTSVTLDLWTEFLSLSCYY